MHDTHLLRGDIEQSHVRKRCASGGGAFLRQCTRHIEWGHCIEQCGGQTPDAIIRRPRSTLLAHWAPVRARMTSLSLLRQVQRRAAYPVRPYPTLSPGVASDLAFQIGQRKMELITGKRILTATRRAYSGTGGSNPAPSCVQGFAGGIPPMPGTTVRLGSQGLSPEDSAFARQGGIAVHATKSAHG